jgi:hypothetical protein
LSHNPYSPPQASVADPPVAGPARPKNVTLAIWLLCTALVISSLVSVHQAVYTASGIGVVAGLVTLALIWVLYIAVGFWVLRAAAKGRRWSRVVISIVALLQIVSIVSAFVEGAAQYAAPVRFLEMSSANAWFRKRG